MTVYFYDGSHAECSEVEFCCGNVMMDGVRYALIDDVETIEDGEFDEE